jgi:hypothetical protein
MNDDELGQRLHDELHARINPPAYAPEQLHEHMRNLSSMASIRGPLSNQNHNLRNMFAFAAALVVVTLVGGGLLTWQAVQTGTKSPAAKIEMFGRVDARVAWAESGSDFYITSNAGATWTHSTLPGGLSLGQYEQAMSVRTPSDATPTPILSPEAVPSGGSAQVAGPPGFPNHLYPVFIDADHGWLLSWTQSGDANTQSGIWTLTAHRTTDGGRTWQSSQLPGTYAGYGLIQFVDAEHGWIEVYRTSTSPTSATPAADNTTVLATSDGGASWSVVSTLSPRAFISFTSPTEGWGYGDDPQTGDLTTFLKTADGGRTWSQSDFPSQQGCVISGAPGAPVRNGSSVVVRALCLPNGSSSTSQEIVNLVSADDGRTWTQESANPIGGSTYLSGMAGIVDLRPGQPIPSHEYPGATGRRLQATFDGGKTWITYPTDGLPAAVTAAEWVSADDLWVMVSQSGVGGMLAGELYASHDAGKTWTALLGAPAWPASFQPVPTPIFVAVPTAVAVPNPVQSGPMITSIGRADASVAWVVSSDPSSNSGAELLRVTQDGGATWSEPRPLTTFGDMQLVDADHGWMVDMAQRGTGPGVGQLVVLRTEDGGVNWQRSLIPVAAASFSGGGMWSANLHFRDVLNGVAFEASIPTGSDGKALPSGASCEHASTSDGGVTWSAAEDGPCLMGLTFVDRELGYASGTKTSTLYVTSDGGETWSEGSLPLPPGVPSDSDVAVKLMERRADGSLRAVVAWWGGSEAIVSVVSSDGGRTWSISGTVSLATNDYQLAEMSEGHWLALSTAVSLGSTAENATGMVTDDAGVTWKPIAPLGLPAQPSSLAFVSATDGWAAAGSLVCDSAVAVPSASFGENAKMACAMGPMSVYATTDGGATWKTVFTP